MIKAVFFDLGNTLVNMSSSYSKDADMEDIKRLKSLGVSVSNKHFRKVVLETERIIEKDYKNSPKRHEMGFFFHIMCELLGINIPMKTASEMSKITRKNLVAKYKLMPGSLQTLKRLKSSGLKLAIVANSSRKKAYQVLNKFKITKYFDLIVISQDAGKEKSTGLPFEIALKKLNLTPDEAIAIGDRIDEDVYGAGRLGIKTARFNFGYWKNRWYGKTVKPDFTINSIDKVTDIIEKLNKT